MRGMNISTLARQARIGIDTVRYYERKRLLPAPARTSAGYRSYTADSVQRLRFIRRAKELGFTLEEIRQLLSLTAQREHGVAGVKHSAQAKLRLVQARISELERIAQGLQTLIAACPGHGPLASCPIVQALAGNSAG